MSNKRKATYVEKLTEAQQLTHNAMPHSLNANFEPSMLSALDEMYCNTPQIECLLNVSKNVLRRVPDIELQQTYLTDLLFTGNICMIPALNFV